MARIRYLALESKLTKIKKPGSKMPGWLIAAMKRAEELEKRIQGLEELKRWKEKGGHEEPFLPVGEFAWHEAKRRKR